MSDNKEEIVQYYLVNEKLDNLGMIAAQIAHAGVVTTATLAIKHGLVFELNEKGWIEPFAEDTSEDAEDAVAWFGSMKKVILVAPQSAMDVVLPAAIVSIRDNTKEEENMLTVLALPPTKRKNTPDFFALLKLLS